MTPVVLNPLSLHGISLERIPQPGSEEYEAFLNLVITTGINIIKDSENWKEGKTYHSGEARTETRSRKGNTFAFWEDLPATITRTVSRKSHISEHRRKSALETEDVYDPHSASGWHLRSSVHKEFSYERFRDALLVDHSSQEVKYIHTLTKADQRSVIEPRRVEIWNLFYSLPFPTSDRDFVTLLITQELGEEHRRLLGDNVKRAFVVISIPIEDPITFPPTRKYVRGKYVSVEVVAEVDEAQNSGSRIEWRMATSSTPGGSIPTQIVESTLPKTIAQDVTMFLNWLRNDTSR